MGERNQSDGPGKASLRGTIRLPGDKSITHRAVILSALGEGTAEIVGYLPSEDCERTVAAFREMGISILESASGGVSRLVMEGKGLRGLSEPREVIDCGNSGTTMRLMTGLLSGQSFFSVLTGDASLRQRPMRRVVEPLRLMGGEIRGRSGGDLAPLAFSGKKLSAIDYRLPFSSAQVKSALLLAGLFASGETTISEPGSSRDHTERMFRYLDIPCEEKAGGFSVIGGSPFKNKRMDIPGDISSAAFFLVAASILEGSEITLRGVGVNPTRTGVLDVLQKMGADITVQPLAPMCNEPVADLTVRSCPLRGTVIDGALAASVLDEFPVLCIAAAAAEGETVIRNAQELRVKESDRIETMAKSLRGMGVQVETSADGMRIQGSSQWCGTICETQGDHRIAMSMTVAGLRTEGENKIDDMDCINTSFPGFLDLLSKLKVT
ncbi:MAG: 3-phosphoshikimate 1-carboxyvinyltransferase [Nitrospira sp.]|nr:3-phosphoshikimate 1-carboxyvinyltransferase [Candidatus Manganitrophaceae bacterium]HIL34482.1 3-phosphoshikimate 1-carboxyvinyltransferase [Candidatus Manganitrophaceae bacterium]